MSARKLSVGRRRGVNTLKSLNLGPSATSLRRESVRRSVGESLPADARLGCKRMVAPDKSVQIRHDQRTFTIGEFMLMRLPGDRLWIMNVIGEGLDTTEEKLARMLRRFWRREF